VGAAPGDDDQGMTSRREPLRVAVAGGGVAAAELLLALRALAGERVALEVIAPNAQLPLRAAATAVAFGLPDRALSLEALADETGAALRLDSVEAVAPRARRLRTASGAWVGYDALVVATGVRARAAIPGALTWRDQRDAALLAAAIDEVADVPGGRLALAAPAGVAWTLPLYELALLAAAELERRGASATVAAVTPERRALEVFGPAVSERVEQELADRDVRLLAGTAGASVAPGRLVLTSGEAVAADRVVAVPRLVGRRLTGVPADWNGFVETDERGRVRELAGVLAIGDVTSFPVKQGGLATQQADAAAAVLAARAGADVALDPARRVLRSRLLGAAEPLYLQAELDAAGRPIPGTSAVSGEPPWWPGAKLFGRHLTPWMAAGERLAVSSGKLS
jgi:sulfide:quinone oxidoreductase